MTLIIVVLCVCGFTTRTRDGIRFQQGSWTTVQKLSKTKNKPIFVLVSAKYCHISQQMEKVLVSKNVGDLYNDKFINYRMDPSILANNFRLTNWGITNVPYCLFMNTKHQIMHKAGGFIDEKRMQDEATKALEAIGNGSEPLKKFNKANS